MQSRPLRSSVLQGQADRKLALGQCQIIPEERHEGTELSQRLPCWLGLSAFSAEGLGLIVGWGTKILEVMPHDRKKQNQQKSGVRNDCLTENGQRRPLKRGHVGGGLSSTGGA